MKISFITPFSHPVVGGAESHVLNLAEQLVKREHQVEILTSNLSRTKKIRQKQEIVNNIKIKRFNSLFRIGDFASFWPSVFAETRKNKADIYHTHCYRHPHNLAPYFTKKPCIITPHWPNYPKGIRRHNILDAAITIFDNIFGKALLKKYKLILAVSSTEKQWFHEKFGIEQERIRVIPNGIPEHYLKQRKQTFRKGLRKNQLLIVCLSRMHKSKGLDQVVKIARHFPEHKLIIAGKEDNAIKELKKLAEHQQNIQFMTNLTEEQKLELLSSADIFIHPSHYEAFGIVVLEAFSQGSAVLTSNTGGLPEVVGNVGLTFQDNNPDDLKQKLSQLIKDKQLRSRLAKAGRQKAKGCTWEKIAEDLERIYKKIK